MLRCVTAGAVERFIFKNVIKSKLFLTFFQKKYYFGLNKRKK